MLKVFKSKEQNIVENKFDASSTEKSWICMEKPTDDEIVRICDLFKLPKDFIEDPLDEDESSRLESADNAHLMIIQTPYFDEEDEYIKFKTLPLGIILTESNVITVSATKNEVLSNFYRGKIKKCSLENHPTFILNIIKVTIKLFLRYIKKISNITHTTEYRLEKAMDNSGLMDFLDIQKSIVYFTTALRSNETVLKKFNVVIF